MSIDHLREPSAEKSMLAWFSELKSATGLSHWRTLGEAIHEECGTLTCGALLYELDAAINRAVAKAGVGTVA